MIWIITFIEFVLGSALHFAYDLFPYPIVAIIAPVNESIFEHLKLVLYPMLLVSLIIWYKYKHKDLSYLTGIPVGIMTGIMSVVFIYYFYHTGLGIDSLIVDIILLFVGILIGNVTLQLVEKHHWKINPKLIFLIIIAIIFLFSVWTFYPPHLPIFID